MAKSVIDVKILGDNKGLSKSLADSESKLAKFGVAVAAGMAVAGAAAGAALFKIGQSFDKEYDKIRIGTGATGDALVGLQDSFKNVLKEVPASFGDAGTAIADLNTRLGLTGKPLEDLAGQFINLSRITKTDLSTNVDQITRVFGDWGVAVDDQAASMDALYRAAQASGIGLNDLSGSVVQFGAPLRNLGFGFDESLALLAQFNKTGVNTETVFAGLKAGVGKLAKAGEDVPTTFRRVVDEITALGPGSEATRLAIELFGQRAGPDLADAITGGKFAIDDMMAAITQGSDTINGAAKDTESFGEKWTRIKNRVLVALEPLAVKVFAAVGTAMDKLGPKIEVVAKWLEENLPKAVRAIRDGWQRWGKPVFDQLVEAAKETVEFFKRNWPKVQDAIQTTFQWVRDNKDVVIGALVGLGVAVASILVPAFIAWAGAAATAAAATLIAAAPFIAIGAALAAIGAAAVWAYQNVGWFRDAVDAVASFFKDTVWPILQTTWDVIVAVVEGIVSTVRDNWDTIQAIVTTVFTEIKDFVETIWNTIWGIVESYINIIRGVIKVVTSLIKGDWSGVWDGIKQILSGVWDGIKTTVSGALDLVVGWIKAVPGRIFGVAYEMFDAIKDNMLTVRNRVIEWGGEFLNWVLGLPGKLVGKFSGMWNGIRDAFKGALNWIIDAWNGLEFKVPGFSAFGRTIGGFTLGVPDIPRLHSGIDRVPGPVGSEMLAILQAGERVVPASQNIAGAGGSGPITLIIEGRPFSAMIAEHEQAQVAELMAGSR